MASRNLTANLLVILLGLSLIGLGSLGLFYVGSFSDTMKNMGDILVRISLTLVIINGGILVSMGIIDI